MKRLTLLLCVCCIAFACEKFEIPEIEIDNDDDDDRKPAVKKPEVEEIEEEKGWRGNCLIREGRRTGLCPVLLLP